MIDRTHFVRKETLAKGFELYQTFLAINLHFNKNSDYDFMKYSGAVRGSVDTFNKNPAKHRYCAIGRHVSKDEFRAAMFMMQKAHKGFVPERAVTLKNVNAQLLALTEDMDAWKTKGFYDDVRSMVADGGTGESHVMQVVDDEAPLAVRKYLAGEIDVKTLANLHDQCSLSITKKYPDESSFPIIKMAIDSVHEYMYFVGPVSYDFNTMSRIIRRNKSANWD